MVVKWAIQCVIHPLCGVKKYRPRWNETFLYSVLKATLKFCFLKSFDIYGDILAHVCKRYPIFIFFFIDSVGGRSLIIFLRERNFWTPNNEEITHMIAHFTSTDTNTVRITNFNCIFYLFSLQTHICNYKII